MIFSKEEAKAIGNYALQDTGESAKLRLFFAIDSCLGKETELILSIKEYALKDVIGHIFSVMLNPEHSYEAYDVPLEEGPLYREPFKHMLGSKYLLRNIVNIAAICESHNTPVKDIVGFRDERKILPLSSNDEADSRTRLEHMLSISELKLTVPEMPYGGRKWTVLSHVGVQSAELRRKIDDYLRGLLPERIL